MDIVMLRVRALALWRVVFVLSQAVLRREVDLQNAPQHFEAIDAG